MTKPRTIAVWALLVALGGPLTRQAQADDPVLVVVFEPSADRLPQDEVRRAISLELGRSVTETAPTEGDEALFIGIDDRGQAVLRYSPRGSAIVRSLALPAEPAQMAGAIALMAGNVIRNEARELLASLRGKKPPPEPPSVSGGPAAPAPAGMAPLPAGQTPPRFFASLSAGTSAGWTHGTPEVTPTDIHGAPLAFSGIVRGDLQLTPELAMFVSPETALGLVARLQIIRSATDVYSVGCPDADPAGVGVCQAPRLALALLAKATRRRRLGPRTQLVVSGSAGVGRIRHTVELVGLSDCGQGGNQRCVDTIASGPLLVGSGIGILFDLPRQTFLRAGLDALVAMPSTALNLDASLGLGVGF